MVGRKVAIPPRYKEPPPLALIDQVDAEQSLGAYIRLAWHVVEPDTTYLANWHIDAMAEYLTACTEGQITRLIINIPPRYMKSTTVSVMWPTWMWGPHDRPGERFIFASYGSGLGQSPSSRDSVKRRFLMKSDWYQRFWGDRVQMVDDQDQKTYYENKRRGSMFSTTMGGGGLGFGGNWIVVDDPHNTKQVTSRAERESQVDFFTQTLSRRLDDKRKGVIVIVMQRLAVDDLSGVLLGMGGWEHLKLPGTAKRDERILWPLSQTYHERKAGELLWPAREGPKEIAEAQKMLGSRGYCTPHEAPVLMADLSLRQIGEIRAGDIVMGFAPNGQAHGSRFGTYHRGKMRLQAVRVLSVSQSVQRLVRMKLSSGEIIRCTSDHRWYTKRSGNDLTHRPYAPAKRGSKLYRVCDAEVRLDDGNDLRLAGWLSGFFDGEGSAVMRSPRHAGAARAGGLISFTQGDGRNLPLCKRLEAALDHFGFDWKYISRCGRGKSQDHLMRWYYLTGMSPRQLVRFMQIVDPGKWRKRLAVLSQTYRFIDSTERVEEIAPDRTETVYGLETETGNYVVWGLASSNSGQYDQEPVPIGGAVFHSEWWRYYRDTPAKFSRIVISLDSAHKTRRENDHSVFTIWGVAGAKVYLLWLWRGKVEFPDLKRVAAALLIRWAPDAMLVEDASSGSSLIQEFREPIKIDDQIKTLLIEFGYTAIASLAREFISPPILPINPDKDKLARAEAVTPMVERGDVQLPDPTEYDVPWLPTYLNEFANFTGLDDPEDDQVDSTTQFLNYVRGLGSFNVMEFYRKSAQVAASAASKNGVCIRCTKPILDNQPFIKEMDHRWHVACRAA